MQRVPCRVVLFCFILGTLRECGAVYYEYISESVNFDEASAACVTRNMALTKIDSEQRWSEVYNILTDGNRYYPTADVYIGLRYDQTLQKHLWMDGTIANWTKWFTNEPFNLENRFCVRLGVDADLWFRTTDCSYQHHYICFTEITTTPSQSVADDPSVQHSSSNNDMVIGLSAGFGAFAGVTGACCILCWCCCGTKEEADQRPIKLHSVSRRAPTTAHSRRSPGGSSFDTFVTSRSSKMDDNEFEDDNCEVNIDHEEQTISFHKADDNVSYNDTSSPPRKSRDNTRTFLQYM